MVRALIVSMAVFLAGCEVRIEPSLAIDFVFPVDIAIGSDLSGGESNLVIGSVDGMSIVNGGGAFRDGDCLLMSGHQLFDRDVVRLSLDRNRIVMTGLVRHLDCGLLGSVDNGGSDLEIRSIGPYLGGDDCDVASFAARFSALRYGARVWIPIHDAWVPEEAKGRGVRVGDVWYVPGDVRRIDQVGSGFEAADGVEIFGVVLESRASMSGSSGFPVVWFDSHANEWKPMGIVLGGGEVDGKEVIVAVRLMGEAG